MRCPPLAPFVVLSAFLFSAASLQAQTIGIDNPPDDDVFTDGQELPEIDGTCSEKNAIVWIKVSNTHGIITDSRQWSVVTDPDTGAFSSTVPGTPFELETGTWKVEVWLGGEPSVNDMHDGDVEADE